MFGEVDLFGGGGVEAPEVGGFPGEEGGGEVGAVVFDSDAGADGLGGDEFAIAGDEVVAVRKAFLPAGFSGFLFYTSDAADDQLCVDLGGRRITKLHNHISSHI